MTLRQGILITIAVAVAMSALGGLLGYLAGLLQPENWRVFAGMPPLEEDPSQLDESTGGLILGLVSGFSMGLFVGSTIVAIVSWFKSRAVDSST